MSPKKRTPLQAPPGPFSFEYEEFDEWYAGLSASLLRPAQETFKRILAEMLDQELSDVDRLRIRVSNSRIKNPSRLWHKMLNDRYVESISSLDDILDVIDDLVGVRVTCNNLVDVEAFRRIVLSLDPVDASEMPAGLCIDPDSERIHSKDSGYRAYHINLHTLIPARGAWKHARGELQVRTLLQDSWGELTHEDTYKPGSNMPIIVTNLAKRMADLLATVDDLAQDLRNELDDLALSDAGVEQPTTKQHVGFNLDGSSDVDEAASGAATTSDSFGQALLAETRRVIDSLTKPAPLAQVAWQVQANFGREVTVDWGGHGTFKELLRAAAPDVTIIDIPPGTVVPGSTAHNLPLSDNSDPSAKVGDPPEGVPALVHRLRQRDSGVPMVGSDRLSAVLDAVVAALRPSTWEGLGISGGPIGIREINQLTRHARDVATSSDATPSRANLDYVFKSLYFSQNLRPGLGKDQVAAILQESLYSRASRLGFVLDPLQDREDLEAWFSAAISGAK